MRKAYIVAAKRSAIGTFLGSLTDVDLATVGATVLKETIKQANIDPANLDEVIIGNVIAAGLGQNIARHVAFDAGIPVEVCAQSINMLCGSGLKALWTSHTCLIPLLIFCQDNTRLIKASTNRSSN